MTAANAPTRKTRNTPRSSRGRTGSGGPNPVDVHVGNRVRLRRTSLNMSQEKLGEALGLTFQQVQKYERGANRIGASRLYDLSRVLEVPVAFFYEEMSEETRAQAPSLLLGCPQPMVVSVPVQDDDTKRETLDLVRAYYRITDVAIRKRVFELAKTLAASGS